MSLMVSYYPYGKILREYHAGQIEKYQTTQHERDLETGLDYRGARFYDPDVARFLSLDPHASEYASWSAFNYVVGNPIKYIDPDGKDPREGNTALKVDFTTSFVTKINDDNPSWLSTDGALFDHAQDYFAANTNIEPGIGSGVWKDKLGDYKDAEGYADKITELISQNLSPADIGEQFMRAADSETGYEYIEINEKKDQIIRRRVENMGEGFQNMVAQKDVFSVIEINGEALLMNTESTFYSIHEEINETTNETKKIIQKYTISYSYDSSGGVQTLTSKSTVDAIPDVE